MRFCFKRVIVTELELTCPAPKHAEVTKLADVYGLGPYAARHVGSTPTLGTKKRAFKARFFLFLFKIHLYFPSH